MNSCKSATNVIITSKKTTPTDFPAYQLRSLWSVAAQSTIDVNWNDVKFNYSMCSYCICSFGRKQKFYKILCTKVNLCRYKNCIWSKWRCVWFFFLHAIDATRNNFIANTVFMTVTMTTHMYLIWISNISIPFPWNIVSTLCHKWHHTWPVHMNLINSRRLIFYGRWFSSLLVQHRIIGIYYILFCFMSGISVNLRQKFQYR